MGGLVGPREKPVCPGPPGPPCAHPDPRQLPPQAGPPACLRGRWSPRGIDVWTTLTGRGPSGVTAARVSLWQVWCRPRRSDCSVRRPWSWGLGAASFLGTPTRPWARAPCPGRFCPASPGLRAVSTGSRRHGVPSRGCGDVRPPVSTSVAPPTATTTSSRSRLSLCDLPRRSRVPWALGSLPCSDEFAWFPSLPEARGLVPCVLPGFSFASPVSDSCPQTLVCVSLVLRRPRPLWGLLLGVRPHCTQRPCGDVNGVPLSPSLVGLLLGPGVTAPSSVRPAQSRPAGPPCLS